MSLPNKHNHVYDKWKQEELYQQRECMDCGYFERKELYHPHKWKQVFSYFGGMYHYFLYECEVCGEREQEKL